MPTQSRGFWTCDYCRHPCDTYEEAKEHEIAQCPHRTSRPQHQHQHQYPPHQQQHPHASLGPPSPGRGHAHAHPNQHQHPSQPPPHQMPPYFSQPPQPPPGMDPGMMHHHPPPSGMHAPGIPPYGGMYDKPAGMEPSYGAETYMRHKSATRCISLLGPKESSNLSLEDAIACQNVEFFEATADHAAEADASHSGGTPVTVGQVGLRCIHCVSSPLASAVYSMVFPNSLGAMAACVRMIADQHLCTCGMVPSEIQEACERAAAKRKSDASPGGSKGAATEEDNQSREVLQQFCLHLCHRLVVVDKSPQKTGIEFIKSEQYAPTPAGAAETPNTRPHGGGQYSNERMGSQMSERMPYPPPSQLHQQGYPGRPPHYPGGMDPEDDMQQQTPLQRRHPHPGDMGEGAPPPGYPMYPPGGDPNYPGEHHPNASMHNNGGSNGEQGGPERHDPPPGYPGQQYELPSNFPFFQDPSGQWHCKFCANVHVQYRDPQSVWSQPDGSPPPGDFIDHHLSMCRSYHSSMPPHGMYGGPPQSSYGGSFPPSPYSGWDPHAPPGMHPYQEPPPPYGAYPGQPPMERSQPPPSASGRYHHDAPVSQPPPPSGVTHPSHQSSAPPAIMQNLRDPPRSGEAASEAVVQARNWLISTEKEKYHRDSEGNSLPRLVLPEDQMLLTDYLYYLTKQLKLCRFSEADRKTRGGKREKIKIGYGGLQCVHCADVPNSRKFYWSNVDRLANSFAEIPGHILKCRRCPQQTKDALRQLKQAHPEQMARLPRGSQKVFFRRMWRRLHGEEQPQLPTPTSSPHAEPIPINHAPQRTSAPLMIKTEHIASPLHAVSSITPQQAAKQDSPATKDSDESNVVIQRSYEEAAKALKESHLFPQSNQPLSPSRRILLAIPDDPDWLSDMDCFVRKQLEVFCATDHDIKLADSDRKAKVRFGQVGIRCIHCSMRKDAPARGQAVSYPFCINSIYESVREFQRLHLDSCESIPEPTKKKLESLKGSSSLSSVLRKYYVMAAKALGLKDSKDGIEAGAEPTPLGSKAVFSFAEGVNVASSPLDDTKADPPGDDETDKLSPASSDDARKRKDPETNVSEQESQQKTPRTSQEAD